MAWKPLCVHYIRRRKKYYSKELFSPALSIIVSSILLQVHNRMTMEEYGRLMVNYKDTPAEQQQKQTRQMSYVESSIDW